MSPATLARLALAGTRTDTLRVVLTGLSAMLAALAILAALTVLAIPTPPSDGITRSSTYSEQYTNALLREPGLRPGVAFALVLLTIPVLALAGQCARLGAPARDRRLAAIRLAGATPRQATLIAVAETGLASLLGAGLGLGVYLLGRRLLHRPDADGRLPLPTDVLPSAGALAAVVVGLPLLAAVVAAVMMRWVTVTPFGVVRKVRRERAPLPWPGVLIGLGLVSVASLEPLARLFQRTDRPFPMWLFLLLLAGGALLAALGVVLGTGWVSYTAGRVLHRLARRPALLIAARRLTTDPWNGSRTFAALLVCLIFGAGATAFRASFETQAAEQSADERHRAALMGEVFHEPTWGDFYLRSMDLVDTAVLVALAIATGGLLVALAEAIVARRRAMAALVATGVPRGVLHRAVLWQALAPVIPAALVALTVGFLLGRSFIGGEITAGGGGFQICTADQALCDDPATAEQYLRAVEIPVRKVAVPVPYEDLAVYGIAALLAVLVTVGVGLLFQRGSVHVSELRAD